MSEQERPKHLDVHADNASAAKGVELHNEACENARWAKVLEGRIVEAIAACHDPQCRSHTSDDVSLWCDRCRILRGDPW